MEVYNQLISLVQADELVIVIVSYLEFLDTVRTGDVCLVQHALALGTSLFMDWAIRDATFYGHFELSNYLLSTKMEQLGNVEQTLNYGVTIAAHLGRADLVALYGWKGAAIVFGDSSRDPYLRGIAGNAGVDVMQELLHFYPPPLLVLKYYCSRAVKNNKVALARFFVQQGAALPSYEDVPIATLSTDTVHFLTQECRMLIPNHMPLEEKKARKRKMRKYLQ